jgi:hypothetical protein
MTMILGIDPGPIQSAYVVWNGATIIEHGKVDNVDMLQAVYAFPEKVVIEMIASYGMAVGKEVFETVFWIGRFYEAARWEPSRRTRGEVKMHLCQSMRAKDNNIRQALIDRFGAPGTKKAPGLTYGLKADTWQAFALAVTYWDLHKAD